MLGLLTDLETSLEREPDFFRTLVENSEDLILVLDREARLVYVSPSVTHLLGYKLPIETLGQPLWDFIHPGDLTGALAAFRRVLEMNRTRQPVDLRVRHQDGSWRHFAARASVMADSGQGARLVVNGHDITERKHAEAQRRRMQEALVRAQKLESLGVLAGGIAHDLNNALGAIMGHASLALSKLPHGAAPRNLGAVLDAAERAAALSRRLLAFSGHGAFELRRLELRAFVAESQPLLQAAVATPIRLEIDLGADALPLDADPAQLGQALLELVQNAVEAITPRPGIIRVATRLRQVDAEGADTVGATGSPLSPGRYACLLVEDDGGGIEPEVLGRIFDPFFSTRFTGRGLGLPAVLGIARSHRGDVAVASTPGAGSRFELLLPAAKPVAAAAAPTPAPTGRGVLVVDDEPALRVVVIETLNAEGIPAWGAADGPQALRMIDEMKDAIAVVMLDLSPPGARGEETLRALRNRGADAKVLLTSGHTESALPALPRARPDAFLQKPYHTKALLEAIRSLLGAPPTTSPSS